jgi:4-diphosphocytidyl-2-C-methyl-D-erythritol kinase
VTRLSTPVRWADAHAKVNLGLSVTGRRPDGFHTLDSVFLRLALHDHLEVRQGAHPDDPDVLEVIGDTGVPGSNDLVLRAARALRATTARRLPGLRFRLEKRIPVAAGLGGGSADAAAALELAAAAWGLDLPDERRGELAMGLGADVPFCLSRADAARVRGIGELITRLPAPSPPLGVLLLTPQARLATPGVFAAFDDGGAAHPDGGAAAIGRLANALARGADPAALVGLASELRDANDLWPAASTLLPALRSSREALEAALGRPCLLTGSGPTLVALYPSREAAEVAAARLADDPPPDAIDARIIATATNARGGTS